MTWLVDWNDFCQWAYGEAERDKGSLDSLYIGTYVGI